jgi:antitoxin YefM
MEVTSITELRKHLKAKLDIVSENKEAIIIHRAGQEDIIMLPISEYNSWKETQYLLSTEANREVLKKSIKQAAEGEVVKIAVDDIWK